MIALPLTPAKAAMEAAGVALLPPRPDALAVALGALAKALAPLARRDLEAATEESIEESVSLLAARGRRRIAAWEGQCKPDAVVPAGRPIQLMEPWRLPRA